VPLPGSRARRLRSDFGQLQFRHSPIVQVENHGSVQLPHLSHHLGQINEGKVLDALGVDPVHQFVVTFRRPSRPDAVFDVLDPHWIFEHFLADAHVMRRVGEDGIQMEGELIQFSIATDIEPVFSRHQLKIATCI